LKATVELVKAITYSQSNMYQFYLLGVVAGGIFIASFIELMFGNPDNIPEFVD
jgi:hypothetical protein